jgi:Spy/CpxP family protein refolding chaperone
MTTFVRIAALAALPVVLLAASASAQDEKKKGSGKPRLPNNWKQLDLTEEQREKYYQMAGAREKQMEALKADIDQLQSKLTTMRKKYKELDDGDDYLTLLTEDQKQKLAKLKAESAKRSAEKAAAKAKAMEKGGKTPTKKTEKKTDGK